MLCVLSRSIFCFSERGGGSSIDLKIEKKEFATKVFRLDKKLLHKMEKVCDEASISLNQLVAICVEYTLENLSEKDAHD